MPRVPVASFIGPLLVAAGVWCAAGTLSVASPEDTALRLATPASWWWLAGGLLVAWWSPPWRRSPLLATPALLPVLPWLPIPLPAAALIWTGHLAWLPVGLAVLAALRAQTISAPVAAPGPAAPAASPERAGSGMVNIRRDMSAAGLLTVLAAVLAAWSLSPRLPGGDEPHYLVIAESLMADGDLRVENNHAARDYAAYFAGDLPPHYIQRGQDGNIYSIHAPGLAVLVTPLFAAFGYRGAQATVMLLAGITGALIWLAGWMATKDREAAWLGWAAVAGSATFVVQSVMIFPDGPAAAAVAASVVLLLRLSQRHPISTLQLLTYSALLAVLPFLHSRFVVIAAGLGVAIVWVLGPRRRVVFLALPALAAAGWFGYFYVIYGTPNPVAAYGSNPETSLTYAPGGVAGLLFDQQYGLLAYAPVLAAAIAGWIWWPATAGAVPRWALAGVTVLYLAAAGTYWMWWAGVPATPARFATAVLPLLAAPVAIAWSRAGQMGRTIGLVLLTTTLATSGLVVGLDRGALAWNTRDAQAAWLGWMQTPVDLARAWPSFFWDLTPGDVSSEWPFARHVALWGVVSLGTAWLFEACHRRLRGSAVSAVVCGVWWLPVVVTIAATGSWALNRVSPLQPAGSQLAVLSAAANGSSLVRIAGGHVGMLRDGVVPGIPFEIRVPRAGLAGDTAAGWGSLRDVPAGLYDLSVEGPRPSGGVLTVRLGGTGAAVGVFTLERTTRHNVSLPLPAGAAQLLFQLDEASGAVAPPLLSLSPREVWPHAGAKARVVSRSNRADLFFLDDGVFVERDGFWVRGGRAAEFVVSVSGADGGAVTLDLSNGPASNRVTVATGGPESDLKGQTAQVAALAPSESRQMPVPLDSRGLARVRIVSPEGFRPSASGGGPDQRFLGVRVSLGAE